MRRNLLDLATNFINKKIIKRAPETSIIAVTAVKSTERDPSMPSNSTKSMENQQKPQKSLNANQAALKLQNPLSPTPSTSSCSSPSMLEQEVPQQARNVYKSALVASNPKMVRRTSLEVRAEQVKAGLLQELTQVAKEAAEGKKFRKKAKNEILSFRFSIEILEEERNGRGQGMPVGAAEQEFFQSQSSLDSENAQNEEMLSIASNLVLEPSEFSETAPSLSAGYFLQPCPPKITKESGSRTEAQINSKGKIQQNRVRSRNNNTKRSSSLPPQTNKINKNPSTPYRGFVGLVETAEPSPWYLSAKCDHFLLNESTETASKFLNQLNRVLHKF